MLRTARQNALQLLVADTRGGNGIAPVSGRVLLDGEMLHAGHVGILEDLSVIDLPVSHRNDPRLGQSRPLLRHGG